MRILIPLAWLSAPAFAATHMSLTPDVVPPGGVATLRIQTDTGATPEGLDQLTGLDLRATGRSTQLRVIQGAMSQQATYTYTVVPSAAGRFTLGPFRVGPDQTEVLTLTADPSAAPPAPAQTRAPVARGTGGDRAFLRLWLGDDTPYVGQSVPVTVSAYLREDVGGTLEGLPHLIAGDTVLEGLEEEPTRSQTEVKGVPYTRFTWTASLTPVRAGSYPLEVSLPATLQWVEHSDRGRRRSLIEDMFANDPFFQRFGLGGLGGGFDEPEVKSAHVELKARRDDLVVSAPPLEGRPEGFTGAVGQLSLQAEALPSEGAVGEPLELRWSVEGTGNLATLTMPGLPSGEGYTTYPPERSFEPSVRSGTKGVTRFTQLIVPRAAGPLSLPPLRLVSFDPDTDQYVEAEVPLPTVQVGATAQAAPAQAAPTQAAPAPSEASTPRPLPWAARHGVVWLGPLAWLLVALTWWGREGLARGLGGIVGALGAARRQRELRRDLRQGVATEDAEAFFRAGLALLDASDQGGPAVDRFLVEADRALYGRATFTPEQLQELYGELLQALNHKEAA